MRLRALLVPVAAAAMTVAAPANAQQVNLTGNILNSCVLSVSLGGTLAASTTGDTLSSENLGGVGATVALVSIGARPTIHFSAPVLETPAGHTGSAVTMIRYNTLTGGTQPYTSAASSIRAGALLDTFTVHARVENPEGFANGRYNVQTVATCEQ